MIRLRSNLAPLMLAVGLLLFPAPLFPQPSVDDAQAEREAARRATDRDREDREYEAGQRLLERSQWMQAAERFAAVAALRGTRVDAALYWKAYALDRVGQKAEALAATAELIKGFPNSRWMSDAKALEIREAVIDGLFAQGSAEQLVAIARKETDPALRKELVRRLSTMNSKVAVEYLLEILSR